MTAAVAPTSSLKALLLSGGRGRGFLPPSSSLLSLSLSLSLSLLLLLLVLLSGNKANADDTVVDTTVVVDTTTIVNTNVDEYYNVNETRGEFEFRIQPYPLPIETTTYVDFVFNLPDDLPPLVHIVFGEAIVSQPKHLHHFVLTGCSTKLDLDIYEEGVPLARPPPDCLIPLGQWAPGSGLFGTTLDLSVGVAIGTAMGVQAVQLNVHYTDGEYKDDGSESYKIATDGIKVYYTTDLRDYTSLSKVLINVGFGPSDMYVPPSTERYFLTKTCIVDTKCKDATDKQLQFVASALGLLPPPPPPTEEENTATTDTTTDTTDTAMNEMLANISCPTIKSFCFMGGELGPYVQQLCPVTCGLCNIIENNSENPRNPTSYRATSISYHAHLLGSEMYATLLREGGEKEQEVAALSPTQKQADLSTTTTTTTATAAAAAATTTNMIVKDLKSSEFWNFDNQASTAMDEEYEIQVGSTTSTTSNENEEDSIELVRGVEIKPGDKIQATCVYNSMYREEKTRFGLSTYDEMCIISVQVTFKTPPLIIVDDNVDGSTIVGGIEFSADLNLRTFSCEVMDDDSTTNKDNDNSNENNEDDGSSSSSSSSSTSSPVVLSDIWQGTLDINEDPRNIWEDHPITATDMCTFFPVANLFDLPMPYESRNCPSTINTGEDGNDNNYDYDYDSSSICYGFEPDHGSDSDSDSDSSSGSGSGKIEFLDDTIAGYMCVGGTYNGKDSNEPPLYVTEEDCLVDGGGTSYDAYTCLWIEEWLRLDAIFLGVTDQVKEYSKENWWQPTCCREVEVVVVAVSIEDEDDVGVSAAGVTANATATAEEASSSSTYSSAFGLAIVASSFVVIMMAL